MRSQFNLCCEPLPRIFLKIVQKCVICTGVTGATGGGHPSYPMGLRLWSMATR